MAAFERIGFEEAMMEPLLFAKSWKRLTDGQRVIMKAIYGLPLTSEERRLWSAFNGLGRFDELGYIIDVEGEFPYHAGREAEDVTLVIGRRSGKTHSISSLIAAYEALCGGHKNHVGEKQDAIILQVAQDLTTARSNIRQFILDHLQTSKIGSAELMPLNQNVTADQIRLKNAGTLITVGPPTIKLRGQAIAVCLMDELAVWPKDKESAQPDYEVERAVRPAMGQFPNRKLIKVSSPWTEEGLLWESQQIGTYGLKTDESRPGVIVLNAPTGAMGNHKAAPREYLEQEQKKDPLAFQREYLAQFAQSIQGFLNKNAIRAAVMKVDRVPPRKGPMYVCTIDPAFRKDAFGFCIGHLDPDGTFMLDLAGQWQGSQEKPLSPGVAMASLAVFCREYGIRHMVSDQFHDMTLQEIALDYGISLESVFLTAKVKKQVWGDVAAMLNLGKIKLVNNPDLIDQLLKLEQHLTPFGNYQFYGKKDDMAHAFAMCVHRALQMGTRTGPVQEDPGRVIETFAENREKSKRAMGMKQKDARSEPWYA